jgi:hypothetical protein
MFAVGFYLFQIIAPLINIQVIKKISIIMSSEAAFFAFDYIGQQLLFFTQS